MANIIPFKQSRLSNLAIMTTDEKDELYIQVCQSLGLNPLTRPLEFIVLNGKLQLYCLKEGAAQLRRAHRVSLSIVGMTEVNDVFTVHVRARTADGREDEDIGCVQLPSSLKGEARANAMMKAVTKAKRRATLSVCGLGLLDETEVETIPAAAKKLDNMDRPPVRDVPSHDDETNVREIECRRAAATLKSKLPQYVVEPPSRRLKREMAEKSMGAHWDAKLRAEQLKPGKFRQPLHDERNPPPSDDIPPFLDRRQ